MFQQAHEVRNPSFSAKKASTKGACFFDGKIKDLNPSAGYRQEGGRLRARPVDEEASKKEWQEHNECEHTKLCEV